MLRPRPERDTSLFLRLALAAWPSRKPSKEETPPAVAESDEEPLHLVRFDEETAADQDEAAEAASVR